MNLLHDFLRCSMGAAVLAGCSTHQAAPEAVASGFTGVEAAAARVTSAADAYLAAMEATPVRWSQAPPDRVPDNSPATLRAWEEKQDEWLRALEGIDPEALWGRPEWVTYVVLRERLEAGKQLRACRSELWELNPNEGWQVQARWEAAAQPTGTARARAQALARWAALPQYVERHTENLREGVRQGYTAPKANVRQVLAQIDEAIAASPFLAIAVRDGDPEFRRAMEDLVESEISPALRSYREFLQHEYLPRARETVALSDLPTGRECYRALVRFRTSLDLSPEEVHERGKRVEGALRARLREVGSRRFGSQDALAVLRDSTAGPANTFGSSGELLAHAQAALLRARAALPLWFGILPGRGIEVRALTPGLRQDQLEEAFLQGALDPRRPALLPVDTANPASQSTSAVEAAVFGFGLPGGHLLSTLTGERAPAHPLVRLIAPVAVRAGWGLYAQDLALEMGLYSSPVAALHVLQRRRGASDGWIVDPALHALGWSREQATEYLAEARQIPPAAAARLLVRPVAEPGWMPVYGTTSEELIRLRDAARRELGPRFDIREFHDRLLEDGPLPLPALQYKIDRWIAERQRASR